MTTSELEFEAEMNEAYASDEIVLKTLDMDESSRKVMDSFPAVV